MRAPIAAVLALLLAPSALIAQSISITTAEETLGARSIAIKTVAGRLALEYVDLNGKSATIRCSDVVEISVSTPVATISSPPPDLAELITTAGDSLVGTLALSEEGSLTLSSTALGNVPFAFEQIDQLRFLANRSTWPKRGPAKRDNDSVFTTSGDQRQGSFRGASRDGVVIHSFKLGRDVRVPLSEASSLFFTTLGAAPARPAGLYSVAILIDGSTLQGTIASMADGTLKMTDLYGKERSLSSSAIASLYFKNGRVLYLSDLPAARSVENANYIHLATPLPSDLVFPYQRDRNVKEKPLKIRGQTFQKGIGVHARSELTWTVDKRYTKFHATIGIDDAANEGLGGSEIGNVTFTVLGDGVKLFESGPVTPKDKPRPVSLNIEGRKELTLIVDFGEDRSGQGDLADWALARVIE